MESKKRLGVLRRRSDFLAVSKSGKRIQVGRWLVVNYLKTDLDQIRCGWTIPKQVGTAVTRNRIRRWCREILKQALHERQLQSLDINIFIRPIDAKFYKAMRYQQFKDALEQSLKSLRART